MSDLRDIPLVTRGMFYLIEPYKNKDDDRAKSVRTIDPK